MEKVEKCMMLTESLQSRFGRTYGGKKHGLLPYLNVPQKTYLFISPKAYIKHEHIQALSSNTAEIIAKEVTTLSQFKISVVHHDLSDA